MNPYIVFYSILSIVSVVAAIALYFLTANTMSMFFFLLFAAHCQTRADIAGMLEDKSIL